MFQLQRTDSSDPHFIKLVKELDSLLAELDGEEHAFYNKLNTITHIKHCIVAFDEDVAVACGALRSFDEQTMEIKRMYTKPTHRGKGLATLILKALEDWACELGFQKCVLETGKRQPEAIALYKKNGYELRSNYGQYVNVENSVCFQKDLA